MSGIKSVQRTHKRRILRPTILVACSLALFSTCGAERSTPPSEIRVTIAALSGYLGYVFVTESIQFTATVHNSTNNAVTWSLSGAGCSGDACGTISNTGLYIAPVNIPDPPEVTLTATSVADSSKSAGIIITVTEPFNCWTWMSGSNIKDQAGVYGTKGTPSLTNVPGARYGAVSWLDSQGNFWLFGGRGYDSISPGYLGDTWKYSPKTLEWTWQSGSDMVNQAGVYGTKGTADPSNAPGARDFAVSWVDPSGNLWLFGGEGYDMLGNFGRLNDLWKYDPTSSEWTWVSGSDMVNQAGVYGTKGTADPSNVPGARYGAVSWRDSNGNLWLFGGGGYDGNYHNFSDVWKYDPTTLEWTWISGSNTINQAGVYGTKGTADPSNVPGARFGAVSWLDSSGKLWLFGGFVWDEGWIDDLWKYDPITLEWTWVSGSKWGGMAGLYREKGKGGPEAHPGARYAALAWLDSSGKVWLFGGFGTDGNGAWGPLNDLWKYDPITHVWIWISGSSVFNEQGVYGTQRVAATSSVPGARYAAVSWLDSNGRFWIFGGVNWLNWSPANTPSYFNDLWQYIR